MRPPLRPMGNERGLWQGLRQDDLQLVSTDHCPFCMKEQKDLGKKDFSEDPQRRAGTRDAHVAVVGRRRAQREIDLNRFVQLTATAPAKLFGLYPKKGTIAVGSDADIVVFDPEKKQTLSVKTLHMKVDYNPYEGREVMAGPKTCSARQRADPEREVPRQAGRGALPPAQPLRPRPRLTIFRRGSSSHPDAAGPASSTRPALPAAPA